MSIQQLKYSQHVFSLQKWKDIARNIQIIIVAVYRAPAVNQELREVSYIHLKVFHSKIVFLSKHEAQRGSVACSRSIAWLESAVFCSKSSPSGPKAHVHSLCSPPPRLGDVSHAAQNLGPLSETGLSPLTCLGTLTLTSAEGARWAFLTAAQSFPVDV